MATGLSPARAATSDMSDLGELLDLTRPGLAAVAAELAAGNEAGAATELKVYYAGRSGIEYPGLGGAGGGDATADELAAGIFRFGTVTRDFYDDAAQRIDVDWANLWDGTETIPGSAQVLMSDFTFMPTLTSAYLKENDPHKRAAYASAWMDISLDFFADNPTWPQNRNLSGGKRLAQLVSAFSVFRTEPSIDADDLVAYLSGVHATTDRLAAVLQIHVGNNWYVSMARAIYVSAVYLPEFKASFVQEPFAVRSVERFLRAWVKGDGVYREPTFNYQAYVADLINTMIDVAEANGRTLPNGIVQSADWIADALFATRQPNLETALVGDSPNTDAGESAIRKTGERNSWSDFTWVASGRTEGTVPRLSSTVFPISYAAQRSGWDADARYMLINNQNSSYTASHRHPDDLSLVMAAYGRPLIVDPGAGDYSATPTNDWMRRTTEAHNTVEVDGQPQPAGLPRSTSLWRSNAGLDLYRGQTQAYRPIAHDRVVYFVKPGFWVVSDDLRGDAGAHDYRQLWHFPGDPVTVDPATNVATVGFDTVPGATPVAGVQLVPVAQHGAGLTSSVHKNGAVRVGEQVLTDVDYLSYDWSAAGATGVDTVVVPGKAGAAPSVKASRIDLPHVDHTVASALEIDLPKATGRFYLSREAIPSSRQFGAAATDAETAYLERADKGRGLTRYALTQGSSLVDDGDTVIKASGVVSDVHVELQGATAQISLGDPFTGTLSITAPKARAVKINGIPAAFTRTGNLVTVSAKAAFTPKPLLNEEFTDTSLDSTLYDFNGSLDGWTPVQGTWTLGGAQPGTQLVQTSSTDTQSLAVQQDVPDDVVVTADIVPGTRNQTTATTGLAFRYHDSRNYYRADVVSTSGGAKLQLVKVYNATSTLLAQTELPINADSAHALTVSAVGKHLIATVGNTSISADDTQLPTGGAAASTQGRAAAFDNVTITEGLDQATWRGIAGKVSVNSGQLKLTPTDGRAHVLAGSTLPSRFSESCDYAAKARVTINGSVGTAGISLRDTSDSYGYRIHVGKTSGRTQYASIVREAHASGPVTVGTVSLSNPLTGPIDLGAAIHGDRITVTVNGVQVLEARDSVVRNGGVGLYASTQSTFENLTVARSCEPKRARPGVPGAGPQ
ncbi:hypothetical protein GCM10009741_17060 [Kribbella lupini]|uniref:Heparinase II/III-like protein n=2 Tax=Kribbella lupini TaxID=291602 RepID=A0ABN2AGI6_9ACTN